MINIPRKIFVTKKSNKIEYTNPYPVGNSSGEKRKYKELKAHATVFEEHDNVPLPGFLVEHASFDGSWRIIDPRGFSTNIDHRNMERILQVTGITEGLIQQMCVWARDNNGITMHLMPTTAANYAKIQNDTELLEVGLSTADINIGDRVRLKTEIVGVYCGKMTFYGPMDISDEKIEPQMYKNRFVYRIENDNTAPAGYWYHITSSNNVVEVLEKTTTPVNLSDSVDHISDEINSGIQVIPYTRYITSNYTVSGKITGVLHKKEELRMVLREVDRDEAEKIYRTNQSPFETGNLIVENHAGQRFTEVYSYETRNILNVMTAPVVSFTPEVITLGIENAWKAYNRAVRLDKTRQNYNSMAKYYAVEYIKEKK